MRVRYTGDYYRVVLARGGVYEVLSVEEGPGGKVLPHTLAPHRGRRTLPRRPVRDRGRRHPFDTGGLLKPDVRFVPIPTRTVGAVVRIPSHPGISITFSMFFECLVLRT